LKPEAPKGYIDLSKVGNGAIFEGTKGSIFADFTSRVLIPNNDDGDLTYYTGRKRDELLPLVNGTGTRTQMVAPRPGGAAGARPGANALPKGFTAMPSANAGASGFADVQFTEDGLPAALGLPNPNIETVLAAMKEGRALNVDPFQLDWLNACKGRNDKAVHGTSTKTHCDFDYSGTMIEQMLLGLIAHRIGKKLTYDPASGRITNSLEANDYLKRKYRSGWTLNG
jgi:hypothetical protein